MKFRLNEMQSFLKWTGGKTRLLPTIQPFVPSAIQCYYEPMIGGGAVFLRFGSRAERAVIGDVSLPLVLTWTAIRDDAAKVCEALARMPERPVKSQYAQVRADYNDMLASDRYIIPFEIAWRFLYLNWTCFNGKYTVNAGGSFNNSLGHRPANIERRSLLVMEAQERLAATEIVHGDFSSIRPSEGDFVYLDPPYDGAVHTKYAREGFGDDDHKRLHDTSLTWIERGATVLQSNNDTQFMRELYCEEDFIVYSVENEQSIGTKRSGNKASELLISSCPPLTQQAVLL